MNTLTADFTALRLDEMEAAFGGFFVRVRASLGASAFGMQCSSFRPTPATCIRSMTTSTTTRRRSTSC